MRSSYGQQEEKIITQHVSIDIQPSAVLLLAGYFLFMNLILS